jgi:hypothetical protein
LGTRRQLLRPSEYAAVAMSLAGILAVARLLGVVDPPAIVVLAMAWTCPAVRRLMAWRRGGAPQWQLTLAQPAEAAAVLAIGGMPWLLLPAIHYISSAPAFATVTAPQWLRFAGVVLTLAGITAPFWKGKRTNSVIGPNCGLEALGMCAVSGHPLIVVLGVAALATAVFWGRIPELRPRSPLASQTLIHTHASVAAGTLA